MRMSIAGPETEPPKPPLPLPRNFPFHFAASGNQTSAMIAESDEGVSVAAARQKPTGATIDRGRSFSGIAEFSDMATAEVIFPSVRGNLARSSQDALAPDANETDSSASAPAKAELRKFGGAMLFF